MQLMQQSTEVKMKQYEARLKRLRGNLLQAVYHAKGIIQPEQVVTDEDVLKNMNKVIYALFFYVVTNVVNRVVKLTAKGQPANMTQRTCRLIRLRRIKWVL